MEDKVESLLDLLDDVERLVRSDPSSISSEVARQSGWASQNGGRLGGQEVQCGRDPRLRVLL